MGGVSGTVIPSEAEGSHPSYEFPPFYTSQPKKSTPPGGLFALSIYTYLPHSLATPDFLAASATAAATVGPTRLSNASGRMYWSLSSSGETRLESA